MCWVFLSRFRYHCHTLLPVSRRAVEMVTLSKALWTGTQVPSCQHTNFQVFGTLLTRMEGNTATTACLCTHNKVCHHKVRDGSVNGSGVIDVNLMKCNHFLFLLRALKILWALLAAKMFCVGIKIFRKNTDKDASSLNFWGASFWNFL